MPPSVLRATVKTAAAKRPAGGPYATVATITTVAASFGSVAVFMMPCSPYRAAQGAGFQPWESACFLKCVLVMNGTFR